MCRATIRVRPVPTQFTECGCIATWISPASPKEEQIDMACEGKTFFIQKYFSDFRKKIERLDELFKGAFEEEVWTLCVVLHRSISIGEIL
jgi:hypothetical protein